MEQDRHRDPESSFGRFVEGLRGALDGGLPGPDLQAGMAPSHRKTVDVETARTRPHKEGAVLVFLFPVEDEPWILFTVRHADLKDHAGQVSFPGGRRETGETLLETSIREAEEEIGAERDQLEVLGELTPLFIPPSRYIVHPFLAVARTRPEFVRQEAEVDRIIEAPLRALQNPDNQRSEIWTISNEQSRVPWYHIDGERIWGATAMITSELLAVVERVDKNRNEP